MKYVIDGSPMAFEVSEIRLRNLSNGVCAAAQASDGGIITNTHSLEFQFEDIEEQETFVMMVVGMQNAMMSGNLKPLPNKKEIIT